jgi:alpha-beta hydrolase superfamily lysophospholipase
VHGWPQTWYTWRLVMPALARDFFVVAPDQRGTGLSGKPQDGYDTGTLAGDLVALMDALAMARGALPVRTWETSSAKVVSRMWCSASMPQCPRLQSARRAGLAWPAVRLVTA